MILGMVGGCREVMETTAVASIVVFTRGGSCQHGFMCGCKQWSNDIHESN